MRFNTMSQVKNVQVICPNCGYQMSWKESGGYDDGRGVTSALWICVRCSGRMAFKRPLDLRKIPVSGFSSFTVEVCGCEAKKGSLLNEAFLFYGHKKDCPLKGT